MGRQIPFTKVPMGALASLLPPATHPLLNALDQMQDRLNEALRPLRQSPQQLVTAKGSIVAATGNGAPVEHKASSTDGLPLVTDSTQTTGLAYSALSLTSAVSGVLPIAQGGTNGIATPTNGGVTYGTGTAQAYSAAGTSGQLLRSAGAASPVWAGDTAWTAATFTGGTPFGNFGSGYATAAFRKDGAGGLLIKGLVNLGTSGGTIFTLPAGYRPLENHQFAQHQYNGAGVNSYAEIVVNSTGTVVANVYTPAVGGNLSIDCYFLAEQ